MLPDNPQPYAFPQIHPHVTHAPFPACFPAFPSSRPVSSPSPASLPLTPGAVLLIKSRSRVKPEEPCSLLPSFLRSDSITHHAYMKHIYGLSSLHPPPAPTLSTGLSVLRPNRRSVRRPPTQPVIIIGNVVSYISMLWFGLSASYGTALAARAFGGFFNGILGAWKCMIGG